MARKSDEVAPELRGYRGDAPIGLIVFYLVFFAVVFAVVFVVPMVGLFREPVDLVGYFREEPGQLRRLCVVCTALTAVFIPFMVLGRIARRRANAVLVLATRLLRAATPTTETLTPRSVLLEGRKCPIWYILREGKEGAHRVLAGQLALTADTPVEAQIYAGDEAPDMLAARLPSGKVVLLACEAHTAIQAAGEALPCAPPRAVPWLVRVQMLTCNGACLMIPAMGAPVLLGVAEAIRQVLRGEVHPIGAELVGGIIALAVVSALGIALVMLGVLGAASSARMIGLLQQGQLGMALVHETRKLRSRWGFPRAEMRLQIAASDGTHCERTITANPLRWSSAVAVPVLFDPESQRPPTQLSAFTGPNGFCRIDAEGRVRVRPGMVFLMVMATGMGLVFLAFAAFPFLGAMPRP